MEHASRGRRSGNKGVGARWRGRFRIFFRAASFQDQGQPRGKFRNDDGFFSLGVAPVSEGDSFTPSGVVRHACRHRVTARGVVGGVVAVCFEGMLRGHVLAAGVVRHACRRGSGSTRVLIFLVWEILSHAQERRHPALRRGRRELGRPLRPPSFPLPSRAGKRLRTTDVKPRPIVNLIIRPPQLRRRK